VAQRHASLQLAHDPHAGATVQPGVKPLWFSSSAAFTGVQPAAIMNSDAIANLVITFAILRSFLLSLSGAACA
jgi:hypothetical protein